MLLVEIFAYLEYQYHIQELHYPHLQTSFDYPVKTQGLLLVYLGLPVLLVLFVVCQTILHQQYGHVKRAIAITKKKYLLACFHGFYLLHHIIIITSV